MNKLNSEGRRKSSRRDPANVEERIFVAFLSSPMQFLQQMIAELAPTDIPVLLAGESGCGKEVLARQIHCLSQRREEPFRKLICAGLTREKIEKLVREGDANSPGTRAGTIFLDEVSDLDLAIQPELLHFISDGSSMQGEEALVSRIISSTARNLEEEIRSGRFREELFYRLNGVCLRLPPLRSLRDDIPLLAKFFSARYSKKFGRPEPVLTPRALQSLEEYPWPGNVRQLENVVKRVVALGNADLALQDLDTFWSSDESTADVQSNFSLKQAARIASRQAERELILKALEKTHWNRKRAAQDLHVSYKALLYKLKQMGLEESSSASNSHGESQ